MLELNQCYNMDCMKGMAQFPDGFFDLAVVDPPYFSGPERRGYYGSKVSKIGVHRDYPVSPVWEIPGRAYFDELRRGAGCWIHTWGAGAAELPLTRPEWILSGLRSTRPITQQRNSAFWTTPAKQACSI